MAQPSSSILRALSTCSSGHQNSQQVAAAAPQRTEYEIVDTQGILKIEKVNSPAPSLPKAPSSSLLSGLTEIVDPTGLVKITPVARNPSNVVAQQTGARTSVHPQQTGARTSVHLHQTGARTSVHPQPSTRHLQELMSTFSIPSSMVARSDPCPTTKEEESDHTRAPPTSQQEQQLAYDAATNQLVPLSSSSSLPHVYVPGHSGQSSSLYILNIFKIYFNRVFCLTIYFIIIFLKCVYKYCYFYYNWFYCYYHHCHHCHHCYHHHHHHHHHHRHHHHHHHHHHRHHHHHCHHHHHHLHCHQRCFITSIFWQSMLCLSPHSRWGRAAKEKDRTTRFAGRKEVKGVQGDDVRG